MITTKYIDDVIQLSQDWLNSKLDHRYGRAFSYIVINSNLYWFVNINRDEDVIILESVIPDSRNNIRDLTEDLNKGNKIDKVSLMKDPENVVTDYNYKIIKSNVLEVTDDFSAIELHLKSYE